MDVIETEQFADASGELDKSARDQCRACAMRLHCPHQCPAARGEGDAGPKDMLDCTDRQPFHQANPFGNRFGELELAVHGSSGDACNLLADTGLGGELVDAFLADHGHVHVGDQKGLPAIAVIDEIQVDRLVGNFCSHRVETARSRRDRKLRGFIRREPHRVSGRAERALKRQDQGRVQTSARRDQGNDGHGLVNRAALFQVQRL